MFTPLTSPPRNPMLLDDMDLYIMRHGIAEEPGGRPDSERPLTSEGIKKLRQAAGSMKALDLRFDLILSSPYARARETAEIVAEVFKLRKAIKFSPSLTPESDPARTIEELAGHHANCQSILLTGHEPHLSRLISVVLSGHTDLAINLKKASLCKLSINTFKAGRCAALDWLLAPSQLRGLGPD